MRTKILTIIMAFAASAISIFAQGNMSVEEIQKAITGEWKLISLQKEGESKIDFSKDNYIWEFTSDKGVKINCPELGQFSDKIRIIKSRLIRGATLIMIPRLVDHGFMHEKFILRKISDDGKTMLLGDWDDSLLYTIRKID